MENSTQKGPTESLLAVRPRAFISDTVFTHESRGMKLHCWFSLGSISHRASSFDEASFDICLFERTGRENPSFIGINQINLNATSVRCVA